MNATGLTADATVLLSGIDFAIPGTVIRMLGEYSVRSTPGATHVDLDRAEVVIGIGIVSTDAKNVGSSAMPDPSGDPSWPWLYWASHQFLLDAGNDDLNSVAAQVRRSFDIRSMRKFKPSESLVMVAQYVDLVGAPALTLITGGVRVLFAT